MLGYSSNPAKQELGFSPYTYTFFPGTQLSNSGLTWVSSPAYQAYTPQWYSWHPDLLYQTLPFSPASFHQGQAFANTCQYPNGFSPLWRARYTQGTQIKAHLLLELQTRLCKGVSNQGHTWAAETEHLQQVSPQNYSFFNHWRVFA